jgi:hypothetical protein
MKRPEEADGDPVRSHRVSARKSKTMQIRSYPDKSYICDGEVQRALSQHAAFRDRVFWRSGILALGCIVGIILGGFLGLPHLVWAFAVLIGITFILLIALVSYTPCPTCPRCSSRMKRRYTKRSRGPNDDLFLVCDHCKVYADAHLSRE